MSQLKSLYHSTAHECTCCRSCYTNNTIQYTNKNVAAERSPRAASTSNVEKFLEIFSKFCRGQDQIVEKEKKHYQGLPEDLTPTAGKVGASAAENKKIDKTERSRK